MDDSQLQDWQVEEIRKGLAEADAGDFVTDEEMAQIVRKWIAAKPKLDLGHSPGEEPRPDEK